MDVIDVWVIHLQLSDSRSGSVFGNRLVVERDADGSLIGHRFENEICNLFCGVPAFTIACLIFIDNQVQSCSCNGVGTIKDRSAPISAIHSSRT